MLSFKQLSYKPCSGLLTDSSIWDAADLLFLVLYVGSKRLTQQAWVTQTPSIPKKGLASSCKITSEHPQKEVFLLKEKRGDEWAKNKYPSQNGI